MPRQVTRRLERNGAVAARVIPALLMHRAHMPRQVARRLERIGAVAARVVPALLMHRAHMNRQVACIRERTGAVATCVRPGVRRGALLLVWYGALFVVSGHRDL